MADSGDAETQLYDPDVAGNGECESPSAKAVNAESSQKNRRDNEADPQIDAPRGVPGQGVPADRRVVGIGIEGALPSGGRPVDSVGITHESD